MFDAKRAITPYVKTAKNPFLDKRVREAFWYAVDMDRFVKSRLYGNGQQIALPFLPNLRGYNPSLPIPKYDIERSKRLLREAGYPNGFSMRLDCISGKYPGDSELGDFLKTSLESVGINAEVNFAQSDTFYDTIQKQNSSAYVTGYSYNGRNPASIFTSLFSTDPVEGRQNRFKNELPDVVQAAENLERKGYESIESDSILAKVTMRIYDTKFIIPLYVPDQVYGISNHVRWNSKDARLFFRDFGPK